MKKIIMLAITCFLIACSEERQQEQTEETEERNTPAVTVDAKDDLAVEDQIKREDIQKEMKGEFRIPTVPIESPFNDEGNIPHVHTEFEIVDEFIDEDGRIYFQLDDNPIRSIISSYDENVIHITNYSDTMIDILAAEAYKLEEEVIEEAYQFFINNPPAQLLGTDLNEYRTWDEATNLERSIIQIVYLIAPTLNDLDSIAKHELYDHEALPTLLEEFKTLGSPNVLIPAPQSLLDIQLYDNMATVQMMWGQLGQFESPEDNREEFTKYLQSVREETTHLVGRVNYTLSEE
ncbi:hypothetical protein [Halalkalibacter hemicellulosilyticus]|uniref:Uncharacterized protein n=1 Tax=Halalkalibacter hemicellulosilyticusJCM 9152 TaxID=1236971 RepID=W4QMM5_9BACI|nr:hypothetical protein [Halalkalibacter hemicellulosilyticus]GAE32589.1 hypothetical protein JCM9152_4128 [Halalkalibacter hemicellulosilyticusJCM 9152]